MSVKKAAIIGFGVTGQSVSRYLSSNDYKVSVFDSGSRDDFDQHILSQFEDVDFNFQTNDFNEEEFDLIVPSPGVPPSISVLERACQKEIRIETDITLFIEEWRKIGPIVGVTGSNGKTTIVNLIYGYLQNKNIDSILAGNIGNSPLDELDKKYKKGTIAVLELSSYQLEYFKLQDYLDICLITNLSSNHLSRHNNRMEDYAEAKMQGIDEQKTKIVVCFDDPGTQKYILPKLKSKDLSLVSLETQVDDAIRNGIYSDEKGNLVLKKGKDNKIIFNNVENRKLIGLHNLYNIALSFAVLDYLDVDLDHDDFFRNFESIEHRIEPVDEIDGVEYVNDSKSTSPDSTRVALESLARDKRVILLLGGKDKGMDYNSLKPYFEQFVKTIVLLPGDNNEKIEKTFQGFDLEFKKSQDLEQAVKLAHESAEKGDLVLLSPASASQKPYKRMEERGTHFKELVRKLKK